jgi:hypothetical protein
MVQATTFLRPRSIGWCIGSDARLAVSQPPIFRTRRSDDHLSNPARLSLGKIENTLATPERLETVPRQ